MSGLVGTYGNIASGEFIIACSDSIFEKYDNPGWWRSYLLCIKAIVAVDWHESRETFYYTLDYGNRISTNWFFDSDIEVL